LAHLENVLAHLQAWGVWEAVRREIEATRQRPRMGKAVAIPLDLQKVGERVSEWLL